MEQNLLLKMYFGFIMFTRPFVSRSLTPRCNVRVIKVKNQALDTF